jgi:hypothetical protein
MPRAGFFVDECGRFQSPSRQVLWSLLYTTEMANATLKGRLWGLIP